MGRPPKRCCKAAAHTSTASGVFSNTPCSCCWEPAGTSRQKFFWSAQSMAANAANSGSGFTDGNESDMAKFLQWQRQSARRIGVPLGRHRPVHAANPTVHKNLYGRRVKFLLAAFSNIYRG